MFLSDVVVTKPGGLSTSECIALKKPMILINPIPGQEEINAQNIENLGLGMLSNNVAEDLKIMLLNLPNYEENFKNLQSIDTQQIFTTFFKDIL